MKLQEITPSRRTVYAEGYGPGSAPVGFVDTTRGGFYRAYCYKRAMGSGPFTREEFAESFARGNDEPANVFTRLEDRRFYLYAHKEGVTVACGDM